MSPRLSSASLALVLLAAAALLPHEGHAQLPTSVPTTAPERMVTSVVTLNPIWLVMGTYTGEYERALGADRTVGISASHWSYGATASVGNASASGRTNYNSVDAKYRVYPGGRALHGLAFAGTAGYTRMSGGGTTCAYDEAYGGGRSCERETVTALNALSVGAGVDYQRLLGASGRLVAAGGAGAKRLVALGNGMTGARMAHPWVRVSVGYGF
jgi:hypothetical protein